MVYVWIDALSNYITGIGYDVDGNHEQRFKDFWPANLHLIGKDILRFHTIYWPIMLMALGIELPKQVFGHPWLLVGEGKMSKSKGNVIYADDLVHLFGVDAVRYLMLHEMPFAQDGTLTYDIMVERINSDLANIMGNLVNRTLSMSNKYFNGSLTKPTKFNQLDESLITLVKETPQKVKDAMEHLRVQAAIDHIFDIFRRCNKYIDETEPWKLAKDEASLSYLNDVLYNLVESIRFGAVLLDAYLPDTSKSILDQINTTQRSFESIWNFALVESYQVTETPQILFARLDPNEVMEKLNPTPVKLETKEEISIDDFAKVDLRVGEVIGCEEHPDSDKLLISKVQIGPEVRTIVSGLRPKFKPSDLIGKKVVVVVNLKPAKLRGVVSEGMLLVAEDGKELELLNLTKSSSGSTIR